jgi:hypothetical protein
MNRSDALERMTRQFEFLGIQVKAPRLLDGQGPAGRIHLRPPWALIILDRWREHYMHDQLQLIVPMGASVTDLWSWINDAAGVWPIEPLGFGPATVQAPLPPVSTPVAPPVFHAETDKALRTGEREARLCWNSGCVGYGSKTLHVLVRSRDRYQLWSCDDCKFWSTQSRFE